MEQVFLSIVKMSLNASWLIAGVLLLRIAFSKSTKGFRMILWMLVGFRLIIPISLQSATSIIPDTSSVVTSIQESTIPAGSMISQDYNSAIIGSAINTYNNTSSINTSFILMMVWMLGVSILLIYSFYSYHQLKEKTKASLKGQNNVYYCDYIASPFILGIINPKIYIPSGINATQKEFIIAHENMHIEHNDYLWKPIGYILLSLHWFNPLVWMAYYCFCKDIELICDERVIKDMTNEEKKLYSQALLECSQQKYNFMICPVAFNETGLKERIKSILQYKKPTLWISLISVVCCVLVGCTLFTDKEGTSSIFEPDRNYIDIEEMFDDEASREAFDQRVYALIEKEKQTEEYQDKVKFLNYEILATEVRERDDIMYTKGQQKQYVYHFYCIGYYSEYAIQEDGISLTNTYETSFPFCFSTTDESIFTGDIAYNISPVMTSFPESEDFIEEYENYVNFNFPKEYQEIALSTDTYQSVEKMAKIYNSQQEYIYTVLYDSNGKPFAFLDNN